LSKASESGARILVIDDEKEIRKLLNVALSGHGFEVREAVDGREGLRRAATDAPDVVILDLGLPDMEGLEVVKSIREWSRVPIIILSVREYEDQKISTLDAGANDYVTKPFKMGELMARIRAAIRGSAAAGGTPLIEVGDLNIDLLAHRTTLAGTEVRLTPTEYELLKQLMMNAGMVLTHKQLLTSVWGPDYTRDKQHLRVYIWQLRKKLESDPSQPRYILTEPGVGYRMPSPDR
jgi:two-component system KDP operon response regulator KdpE